ncbi:MAG: peptidoglycan editing factor PgeF [Thermaerobacter sp.]|nr:peptidoglycan editing factor PgeF [Thermaerobacter sp.]
MGWQLDKAMWRWSPHDGVRAWVTTRLGGVGVAPFDTMNISFQVQDEAAAVRENRRRAVSWSGRRVEDLVTAQQVHGAKVVWANAAERGRGALDAEGAIPGVDGLLTRDPTVVLGLGFADCTPIFLSARDGRMAGVVHAGWRGTVAGIQQEAVRLMVAAGVAAKDLRAGIGPAIGSCCYEVDGPVRERVLTTAGSRPLRPAARDGHWMLDLALANQILLEQAGLLPEHIDHAQLCTRCRADWFFSHRGSGGRAGRMGGYICLQP